MNTFIFEDSIINSIDTFSDTPTKLQNDGSSIGNIESLKTTIVLSGTFQCDFKFINSASINIENDFILNSNNFSVINDETPLSIFYIVGILNPSISIFNINCSTNTKIVSVFFGNPWSEVTINCNTLSVFSDTLVLAPYNTATTNNKLNINLTNISSKNIELFTDLKTLNLSNNSQIQLFVAPTIQVSNFDNFTSNTLSSLSATPEIARQIETQNSITVSLNSTPFQIQVQDGKASLEIPKSYNIGTISSAYVLIGSNRYSIDIKQI